MLFVSCLATLPPSKSPATVSPALTLFLAIAKFSLSAENKSAPSNYLDLAGFLVGLMCVLDMPEGQYSYTHTVF